LLIQIINFAIPKSLRFPISSPQKSSIKRLVKRTKIAYPFSFTSPLKYDFSSAYRTLFLAIDIQLRPDATTVLYRSIEA
jgi:hypothetical protein